MCWAMGLVGLALEVCLLSCAVWQEVDDDWIARRLERWGKRDNMPFIGPAKGTILQQLVADKKPQTAVEVGTMAGAWA